MCSVASTTCCSRAAGLWRLRPAARGSVGQHVGPPGGRTGGATRAPYPGSCRAVERCTCSAGRQRRATRCGSATPRAAPWCRLEASVPASRGALASVAKRGLGSCRARYQSPVGSTRRLAITALGAVARAGGSPQRGRKGCMRLMSTDAPAQMAGEPPSRSSGAIGPMEVQPWPTFAMKSAISMVASPVEQFRLQHFRWDYGVTVLPATSPGMATATALRVDVPRVS